MELRISADDKKTVKMFRRLEKFLDSDVLKGKELLDFQNAETGRVFAVFLTPAALQKVSDYIDAQEAELNEALDTIEVLEDDNALLALIDAQNEVLMGRCEPYQEREKSPFSSEKPGGEDGVQWSFTGNDVAEGPEPGWPTDGVCGAEECSCNTTEASSPDFVAETTIKEHFNVEKVTVTLQEYEELLNLRQKRVRDKQTITELNATVREYKKGTETLQGQRDTNLALMAAERARADYFKQALEGLLADFSLPTMPFPADVDGVTRWIR